jgi:putative membrane protein
MKRFLVRVLINALALWLTTVIFAAATSDPGVFVKPYGAGGVLETVLSYLLVALIFGLVNGIIGNFIRIVAFPIYVLTLGLLALLVNSLLLLLVSWISTQIGFGLTIDGFWWGVLCALVLGLISWVLSLLLRPLVATPDRRRR